MKTVLVSSAFELPQNELWWIIAAGLLVTTLAFVLGARFFGSSQRVTAPRDPTEPGKHDPFALGGQTERRVAHRRRGSSVGVMIADPEQKQPEREGWVLDRSLGGLGLFSDVEMAAGTLIRVKPEHAPALTPWTDVEVKECKPHETGYHLCCAFVKTPPYSILLLFG